MIRRKRMLCEVKKSSHGQASFWCEDYCMMSTELAVLVVIVEKSIQVSSDPGPVQQLESDEMIGGRQDLMSKREDKRLTRAWPVDDSTALSR